MKPYKFFSSIAAVVKAALVVSLMCTLGAANAETLKEKIAKDGTIKIGIWGAYPYGVATSDGNVEGIFPDTLKSMAKTLGVKKIDFEVLEFGALIPSLMSRRIDMVAGGMIIMPSRCKQVAFSDPVGGPQGNVAIVKTGNPLKIHGYEDMAKNSAIRVGDIRGAASVEYLNANGIPKDRVLLFPDKTAAVGALFANRIDVLIYDLGTATTILKDPNVKGLERATPFKEIVNGKEMKHFYGFAFRPEDASLRDEVNKHLAQRGADGTIEKVFTKYGYTKEDAALTGATAKEICGADYK